MRTMGITIAFLLLAGCTDPLGGDVNLAEAKERLRTVMDETAAEVLDGVEYEAEDFGERPCEGQLGGETGESVWEYMVNFEFKTPEQAREIVDRTQEFWEGRGVTVEPEMLDGNIPRLYVENDEGLVYRLQVVLDTKRGSIAGNTGCRER